MTSLEFTTDQLKNERWKPVLDFESDYAVSDFGRVMSIKRNRLMRIFLSTTGYPAIKLYKDGIRHHRRVHQLVIEAFVGRRPAGAVINHINNVRLDNRATNLEFLTPGDNIRHAVSIGAFNSPKNRRAHKIRATKLKERHRLARIEREEHLFLWCLIRRCLRHR